MATGSVAQQKAEAAKQGETGDKGPEAPKSKEVLDLAATAIDKLLGSATAVTTVVTSFQKLAESSTRTYLLAFGGAMIALSVALKLDVFGVHVAKIEPREFISMIALGVLLALAGAVFELYNYRGQVAMYLESMRAQQITQNQVAEMAKAGMSNVTAISTAGMTNVATINKAAAEQVGKTETSTSGGPPKAT